MSGTYTLRRIGAGSTGHTFTLHREEVERLADYAEYDGTWMIGNLVTMRAVKVSAARPLTHADVDRISNTD